MNVFWPQSATEWLAVIIKVISMATIAGTAVWKVLKWQIDVKYKNCRDLIMKEENERKLADSRIEEKLVKNNEDIHIVMGKIEMIDIRLQEYNHKHLTDIHDMKMTLKDGLYDIKIEIEKLKKQS